MHKKLNDKKIEADIKLVTTYNEVDVLLGLLCDKLGVKRGCEPKEFFGAFRDIALKYQDATGRLSSIMETAARMENNPVNLPQNPEN